MLVIDVVSAHAQIMTSSWYHHAYSTHTPNRRLELVGTHATRFVREQSIDWPSDRHLSLLSCSCFACACKMGKQRYALTHTNTHTTHQSQTQTHVKNQTQAPRVHVLSCSSSQQKTSNGRIQTTATESPGDVLVSLLESMSKHCSLSFWSQAWKI